MPLGGFGMASDAPYVGTLYEPEPWDKRPLGPGGFGWGSGSAVAALAASVMIMISWRMI